MKRREFIKKVGLVTSGVTIGVSLIPKEKFPKPVIPVSESEMISEDFYDMVNSLRGNENKFYVFTGRKGMQQIEEAGKRWIKKHSNINRNN